MMVPHEFGQKKKKKWALIVNRLALEPQVENRIKCEIR